MSAGFANQLSKRTCWKGILSATALSTVSGTFVLASVSALSRLLWLFVLASNSSASAYLFFLSWDDRRLNE